MRATSVNVVHNEPTRTAGRRGCAAASIEARHAKSSGSSSVGRETSSRQSARHSREEEHTANISAHQMDACSHQGFTSVPVSRNTRGQTSRGSSLHLPAPTATHTLGAKSGSQAAPLAEDQSGETDSNGTIEPTASPTCAAVASERKQTGHIHHIDGFEAGSSDLAWRSPSPQRVVFRSPFAVAGADLIAQDHRRMSVEYVLPKDISKVRQSVSMLKYGDVAGRKILQATDRIVQLSDRQTKALVGMPHAVADQDQQNVRSARSAHSAITVANAAPSSALPASEDSSVKFLEQKVSRQSQYSSGVKRSASLLSRTFRTSSSPTRSSTRSNSATRPTTDVASDESIASSDLSSGPNSSTSREVLIRVLKGWR